MRKLLILFISLFLLLNLAGCKLVVEPSDVKIVETTIPNYIGVRILYNKHTDFNKNDQTKQTADYYYIDGHDSSPFIIPVKIEDYVDDEGADVHHIELDAYMKITGYCYTIQPIVLNDKGEEEYLDHTWYCGIGLSSTSFWYNYKTNDFNKTMKFTVNAKGIDTLLDYKVVEFDENYNKIKETFMSLNDQNEIILDPSTIYFKVQKSIQHHIPYTEKNETNYDLSLYSRSDLEKQPYHDTIIASDQENNRHIYTFDIKTAE